MDTEQGRIVVTLSKNGGLRIINRNGRIATIHISC